MKRIALLASAFFGAACLASAYDSDPGYGPDRPWLENGGHMEHGRWYGGRNGGGDDGYYGGADSAILVPRYYRPTARFYGNGYTVSYRYIPVFRTDYPRGGAVGESSNFPTASAHLTVREYEAFGNNLARITQKDERSGAPRTAVTSIVRKKTTTSSKSSKKGAAAPDAVAPDMPAISPSTKGAPTPDVSAPASAPAPSAAPDAAAPPSGSAPAKP